MINMYKYRAKLDGKDKLKVTLMLMLIGALYVIQIIGAIVMIIVIGCTCYFGFFRPSDMPFTGTARTIAIILIGVSIITAIITPRVVPELTYPVLLNVVTYGLLNLPKSGRYNKISRKRELEKLLSKPAEEFAEEFKKAVVTSLDEREVSPPEIRELMRRLMLWCIEQVKREVKGKSALHFIKEYYLCLKEVGTALFYISEKSFDDILGCSTVDVGMGISFKHLVELATEDGEETKIVM